MNTEITTTTETTKFDTCWNAWNALYLTPHKEIMAQRKALRAEFDKAMKEYKEKVEALKKADEENHAKWLEAQKTLQGERKDAKEAKAKEAEAKKAEAKEAPKAETKKTPAKKATKKDVKQAA